MRPPSGLSTVRDGGADRAVGPGGEQHVGDGVADDAALRDVHRVGQARPADALRAVGAAHREGAVFGLLNVGVDDEHARAARARRRSAA